MQTTTIRLTKAGFVVKVNFLHREGISIFRFGKFEWEYVRSKTKPSNSLPPVLDFLEPNDRQFPCPNDYLSDAGFPIETYQTGGVQINSTSAVFLLLLSHLWGRSP